MRRKKRTSEDLLNPERTFYELIRDYSEGLLTYDTAYYRAVVEDVATTVGEIESEPPCPVGSVRARVYTYGLDANIPSFALSVFYPLFPGEIPQVGEHVYVFFEDENLTSGLWVSKIPNYQDPNYANPDENPSPRAGDASSAFEGTDTSKRIPSRAQYEATAIGGASREQQEQTVSAFESQSDSIWRNKRVLIIGDSMIHGWPGAQMGQEIENRGGRVFRKGNTGWGVSHWIRGEYPDTTSEYIPTNSPKLPQLISRHSPDIIIIGLGGNDWDYLVNASEPRKARYKELVADLWSQASGVERRFWVGPPYAWPSSFNQDKLERFNRARELAGDLIEETIGSENFIKVSDVTRSRNGRAPDGVHFTRAGVPQEYIRRVVDR